MLEALHPAPPDKILSLVKLFRDDPRPHKIDLGIGMYRDGAGRTPVLGTVREAERRLYEGEDTKGYLSPGGDAAFCDALAPIVFGEGFPRERLRAAQTPGGAGALRILGGLVARARPGARVWLPDPTWVNHASVFGDAGLEIRSYAYYDPVTSGVRIDAMLADLRGAGAGDVVVLHGCCHNPSGADPDPAGWRAIGALIAERGLLPLVDLAYQGFGDGLEADAAAVRLLAGQVSEMMVAVSCSKNFSIYRERTGCAFVLAATPERAEVAHGHLLVCARIAYSMPPDHGASIVRIVLQDPALASRWRAELEAMRARVAVLRGALAAEFARRTGGERFGFLRRHRGMFSLLGTGAEDAERLRREHAVYIVADGRINIAGLREDQIGRFVDSVASVCGAG